MPRKPSKKRQKAPGLKIEGSWEDMAVRLLNTPEKAPVRKTIPRKKRKS